ncbi:ABC transporter ATP-binding protein [Sphingorhabdus sp.]|uniref:ABC transporter ATP-binding protein n=1 Tax=Sphingorhabdus sp. TaxID=1902408 RepID=UPI003982DC4D
MDIRFDALSLTLRGRSILQNVSGHLQRGKVTAILGANGAGKSSLLSCLAGLRTPDSGMVFLDNQPLTSVPARVRARLIGLLPQQADIHWEINVRALVALGRLAHQGRWGKSAADDAAIAKAMTQTDCLQFANRKALRLSGGEQARVLLARVLAGEPDWVLADEPLANLDPAHQMDAVSCLKDVAQSGAGVVLVLHDLTQAARIADHVILMKAGRVQAAGTCAQVLTPDQLAEAFGVTVHIDSDAQGAPIITPIRRA